VNEGEKKLKRGLKDISPLFSRPRNVVETPGLPIETAPSIGTATVFSPDYPGDSLLLNSYLASRILTMGTSCFVLSLGREPENSRINTRRSSQSKGLETGHVSISWEKFDSLCATQNKEPYGNPGRQRLIFLNSDLSQPSTFHKILPVLEYCVFILQPEIESVMEAYRYIKGARVLNSQIRYCVAFEGYVDEHKVEWLYEQFSSMLSHRLQVDPIWLGYLQEMHHPGSLDDSLNLEPLTSAGAYSFLTPAKRALNDYCREQLCLPQEIAV